MQMGHKRVTSGGATDPASCLLAHANAAARLMDRRDRFTLVTGTCSAGNWTHISRTKQHSNTIPEKVPHFA
jgi:hypothetical protein